MPAAGRGERLGAVLPKALVALAGRPLLWHAVSGLLGSRCVDSVVVAAPASYADAVRNLLAGVGGPLSVVTGGVDRTASVRAALALAPVGVDIVLVHDAARCLTPPAVVRAVVAAVRAGAPAVIPVLPVADTVKRVDANGVVVRTLDRSELRAVQTPQGFAFDVLRQGYALGSGPATDDAGLVERLGVKVLTVPGHPDAFKITTAADLAAAELLLERR